MFITKLDSKMDDINISKIINGYNDLFLNIRKINNRIIDKQ